MRSDFLNKITGLTGPGSNESLEASIQEHLAILLNTRRGSVPHEPDYGLPNIHEIYQDHLDAHEQLALLIQKTLTRFEPRLRMVEVKKDPNADQATRLVFQIKGKIQAGSGESQFSFKTEVSRDGRYQQTGAANYG